jgi:hypothetical protein
MGWLAEIGAGGAFIMMRFPEALGWGWMAGFRGLQASGRVAGLGVRGQGFSKFWRNGAEDV